MVTYRSGNVLGYAGVRRMEGKGDVGSGLVYPLEEMRAAT